jgi:hypothetical protein
VSGQSQGLPRGDVAPMSPACRFNGRAPVAQLDRAPDYESGGRTFESFRARHSLSRDLTFPEDPRSHGVALRRPASVAFASEELSFVETDRCAAKTRVILREPASLPIL